MSALNVLVKQPVLPFIKRKKESDIRKIKLEHSVAVNVMVNGNPQVHREKRAATLVVAEDDDVEALIRLCLEFVEAYDVDSLALTDGMKYTEFRKCVADIVLDTYDNLVAGIVNRNGANFVALLHEMIDAFAEPTAFADQKRYMDTFKKPFKITVRELSNRLIIMNKYAQYLPGSNGNSVHDDNTMKYEHLKTHGYVGTQNH